MPFQFIPNRMYMMPVQFGPSCGPRQNKDGERFIYDQPQECTQHILIYETNPEHLRQYLPKGFSVRKPYVIVTHKMHRNLAWLAGRGYNVCTFDVPVEYRGKRVIKGLFLLNIWENHADPIITGREQIGYAKIYADIGDIITYHDRSTCFLSSWDFQFLNLEFTLPPAAPAVAEFMDVLADPDNEGKLHYKYIPKTGDGFTGADVEYVTFTPKKSSLPADLPALPPLQRTFGTGALSWTIPTWEDMPTQFHIVQALAGLEIKRIVGACKEEFTHRGDVYGQMIVE